MFLQETLLEEEKAFYGSDEDEDSKEETPDAEVSTAAKRKPYVMDPDHRLLLRNTKPLLQSRNAAVGYLNHTVYILTKLNTYVTNVCCMEKGNGFIFNNLYFPLFFFVTQVVMAVAQLYFHLAPKAEVGVIAKALVRLMRSHRLVIHYT